MLKNISKLFVAGVAVVALQPLYSMEIYTVKAGDYLYKIAKSHTVKGISTGELTDSIKGINKSEIPGIVDNRIKVGDKLAIPTSKNEVEDGLTLVRNQMMQGTYNASSAPKTPKVIDKNTSNSSSLGDMSMAEDSSKPKSPASQKPSQDSVPNMMLDDDAQVITYGNNLDSKIDSQDTQVNETRDDDSGSIFGKLIKLIFYIIILVVLFIVGKKVLENRNSKRELEQEILSKEKRDRLMSRISPVVSDSDFYKADKQSNNLQEEFDFFANTNNSHSNNSNSEDTSDIVNEDGVDINADNSSSNLFGEEIGTSNNENNIAVKTSKGMVFETAVDDSLGTTNNLVEEVDSSDLEEQEMQFIEELVEQYLDSEKYEEAVITIQDSLEKEPNNIDLRYMLLEVYARVGDEIAFNGEIHLIKSKNIVSMFDPFHQKIAKLKDKYFE